MKKTEKRKLVLNILSLFVYGFSVWAILAWYDWKLLVVLFLFVWANNLTMKANSL